MPERGEKYLAAVIRRTVTAADTPDSAVHDK